jgi:hypothetical protein
MKMSSLITETRSKINGSVKAAHWVVHVLVLFGWWKVPEDGREGNSADENYLMFSKSTSMFGSAKCKT